MAQIRKFEKIFGIYAAIKKEAEFVDGQKALAAVKIYSKRKKVDIEEFEKVSVKEVQNDIKTLNEKLDELKQNQKQKTLELDKSTLEKIILLKGQIRKLKRKITIQKIKIHNVHENIEESSPITQDSFDLLLQYFPGANIKKLEETESFHKAISEILRNESQKAEDKLQQQLEEIEKELLQKQDELYILSGQQEFSQSYIQELVSLQTQLNKDFELLKREESKKEVEEQKTAAEKILDEVEYNLILKVLKRINSELAEISSKILGTEHIKIQLDVQAKKQNSFTYKVSASPDDGTSTEYLCCLSFDLAALRTSSLPCICHDSCYLSDTKGHRLTGLLECYNEVKDKQIFLSIHKDKDFDKSAARKIIEENAVLQLYENGGELFGRSFATKKN